VNLTGIFTVIFTAGKVITQFVTRAQYMHRLINYEKLCAIKFTTPKPGEDIQKVARRHQLPRQPRLPGFRAMAAEDVPAVTERINAFMEKYAIAQVFSADEIAHWFVPREGIVGSYVIERKG